LNRISVNVPHKGSNDEDKRRFWEDVGEVVRGIEYTNQLFLRGDLNSHHIGQLQGVMMMFMVVLILRQNEGTNLLLDFIKTFHLII